MPPRSSATAFERLAPDQRAAVELVLRQGRSYGELSDLLGMPEETIRARARNGIAGLAPDLPTPARSGEIADWLLGQQSEAHAARTRALLLADPAAQTWAATVAEPLRAVTGGDAVPELPTGTEPTASRVNGKSARAKARRDEPAAKPVRRGQAAASAPAAAGGEPAASAKAAGGGEPAAPAARAAAPAPRSTGDAAPALAAREPAPAPPVEDPSASRGRSSRLGGAIIIGAAVVLVAVVLGFVFLRGGDDPEPVADAPAPTATATATATASPNDIILKGPAGSTAVGLMRLFKANDGTVRFALAAQGVAPNKTGETYSLWFRKKDGSAQLLGDVKDPVTDNGELTSAGPGNDDVDKFPNWFATYDTVLVTLDDEGAKEPGKVILSGDLPHSQTG